MKHYREIEIDIDYKFEDVPDPEFDIQYLDILVDESGQVDHRNTTLVIDGVNYTADIE